METSDQQKFKDFTAQSRFRTVDLGTYGSLDELRSAMARNKYVNLATDECLSHITILSKPVTIDLYRTNLAEFGFDKWANIWAKLAELGFCKCPDETGPQLRRQYPDQPLGEHLLLVMNPVEGMQGAESNLWGLSVENFNGHLSLDIYDNSPDSLIYNSNRRHEIVFCSQEQLRALGLI